uniref:Uncharacterized protein n=1 Tax=Megaselia scalaris TaxID=36166 RepID=T1GDT8_MEGSC
PGPATTTTKLTTSDLWTNPHETYPIINTVGQFISRRVGCDTGVNGPSDIIVFFSSLFQSRFDRSKHPTSILSSVFHASIDRSLDYGQFWKSVIFNHTVCICEVQEYRISQISFINEQGPRNQFVLVKETLGISVEITSGPRALEDFALPIPFSTSREEKAGQ